MIISEQEKNRIRGLHKQYSVIKEQDEARGYDPKEIFGFLVNCVIENVGEEKMVGFSESLSDECTSTIFDLMQSGTEEITLETLRGGVACLGDAAQNPETFTILMENWRPVTECMIKKTGSPMSM